MNEMQRFSDGGTFGLWVERNGKRLMIDCVKSAVLIRFKSACTCGRFLDMRLAARVSGRCKSGIRPVVGKIQPMERVRSAHSEYMELQSIF